MTHEELQAAKIAAIEDSFLKLIDFGVIPASAHEQYRQAAKAQARNLVMALECIEEEGIWA